MNTASRPDGPSASTGNVTAALTQFLHDHANEAPDDLAASLSAAFIILEAATTAPTEQPEPAPGQVWRNRRSGRIIQVTAAAGTKRRNPHNGLNYTDNDVHWKAIAGRGPSTGSVWKNNWPRTFDYIQETLDPTEDPA